MPFVVYQFGDFSLACGKFELCGKGRRLKLERKPLELLVLLVTRHGQVVTRDEIGGCLWEREVFVDTEHGINTAIRKIRQILGDSSDLPQFVQTSPVLVTASSHRLRPSSQKSPSQLNLLAIRSTCLLLRRRSLLRPSSQLRRSSHRLSSITDSGWSLPYVPP